MIHIHLKTDYCDIGF